MKRGARIMATKQRVVRWLRSAQILGVAEGVSSFVQRLRQRASNKEFRRQHPGFPIPPDHLMRDAYGTQSYCDYDSDGRKAAAYIAKLLTPHLNETEHRVLEWGCGPGRIIRHLKDQHPFSSSTVVGADYNAETVAWCREGLPDLSFKVNESTPPLPFDDGQFDVVYAISVFTHLSEEVHTPWFDECLRVTAPGGIILITLQGDNYRSKLLPDELEQYQAGKLVVRGNVKEGSRLYVALHSPLFVTRHFATRADLVFHEPNPDKCLSGGQDVWVFRKRAHPPDRGGCIQGGASAPPRST